VFLTYFFTDVLKKVEDAFALPILPKLEISFVHLHDKIHLLDRASRLSLLVESWGTMRLAYTALVRSKSEVPGIFVDTTGCAFSYIVAKLVFGCRVMAYTHYPTISTDMLALVWDRRRATYNNQDYIAKSRITSFAKLIYYCIFAVAYGCAGSLCDLVLVNSTWTYNHIHSLWWLAALQQRIHIVFPPCRVPENSGDRDTNRKNDTREQIVLSIGQFRPEKDHELQMQALAKLFELHPTLKGKIKMVMVGGCRGPADERRLHHLKNLAQEYDLTNSVTFSVNQPYSVVEDWLRRASVGIHTMWNEHFGIGVVEMMAAGLITIAHDSGGPKSDIVVPWEGRPTGLLASNVDSYAKAMYEAFSMDASAASEMRKYASISAARFSDEQFNSRFKQILLESRLLTPRC